MTPSPHTIGREQPLDRAATKMREHRVRHLPVLDGGELLGILSERDVAFVRALRDVDVAHLLVEDAMSIEPFAVDPDATLAEVAREMHRHRYGSAVVREGRDVVGIITTVDVLGALARILEGETSRDATGA
jgi:acetoin utilization protein AcuB